MALTSSSVRLEGQHAQIVWSYHVAAEVDRYVIEYGVLRARLRTCNPFRLTQSPLYFVIDNSAATYPQAVLHVYKCKGLTPPPIPNFERQLLDVRVSGTELIAHVGPRRSHAVTDAPTGRSTTAV